MKNFHQRVDVVGNGLPGLPATGALLAFKLAATHMSFRRAANSLSLSPSAVSHQIRGLEARLGVRLFARGTRSMCLTAAGEQYLGAVTAALDLLTTAGRDLSALSNIGQQDLHVSALPFFTSAVILPSLNLFERDCPGLKLRLEATHQYADFDASRVDVAIRYGRERAKGLRFERLISVTSLPVCAPQHAVRIAKPVDLADLTLIHLSVQPNGWPDWLAANGVPALKPASELWVDSIPAALEAAEHGLGVALAMHPLICGRDGFGRTLIAPFAPSGISGTFHLVMRTEQAQDRRINAFRHWIKAAVVRACGSTAPVSGPGIDQQGQDAARGKSNDEARRWLTDRHAER